MAKFITIGYGDRDGYDRTPAATLDAAHEHDGHLRDQGALMGAAGSPVQVRNTEARGVDVRPGPYLQSALSVAGFAVIEAGTIDDAIALVSASPCAVAHGVVEVWPLSDS